MGGREKVAVAWLALCASVPAFVPAALAQSTSPVAEAAGVPARSGLIRLRNADEANRPPEPAAIDVGAGSDLSSEDLPEVPGFTSAGGTTVSLRGRFRTSVGMRRSPDGALVGECTAIPSVSTPAD
jgi:hypothetical protein